MSRIGRLPITVPAGVTVTIADDNTVTVKGPKGQLSQKVNPDITIAQEGNMLHVARPSDDKNHRSLHGLYRSLLHNMVVGVTEGFSKGLTMEGVG
ncbi:MAG: 50S ribosomal protein L6, partial [Christensenellales bacterium]